jgi:hypothetical protein
MILINTITLNTEFLIRNIDNINSSLEENDYSSWSFLFDKDKNHFYLSIFDEHNPQEELIFFIPVTFFDITHGIRYKRKDSNPIKPEHPKYLEAIEVLHFITKEIKDLT